MVSALIPATIRKIITLFIYREGGFVIMNNFRSLTIVVFILWVFLFLCTGIPIVKSEGSIGDRVIKVEGIKDLFQTGDFYIGGQPNLETLRLLKTQGVTLVVNLRTEAENKEFAVAAFTEETIIKELGLTYSAVPIGDKESYSPKTVGKIAETLKNNSGKTLIHCATGVRATNLWMAYLVRHRGQTLNDAVLVGKQMKFTFPVEDFLGSKVSFTTESTLK